MKDYLIGLPNDISARDREEILAQLLSAIDFHRQQFFPTNSDGEDQDVNIYVANLLLAITFPEYREMADPYITRDTSELLKMIKATEDRTIRYFIFKVNADNLFIDLTLNPNSLRSRNQFELSKLYYDQAAQYHSRIYRKRTGVGDVLSKIHNRLEDYVNSITGIGAIYRKIIGDYKKDEFGKFLKEVAKFEKKVKKQQTVDDILDEYNRGILTKKDLEERLRHER